MKYEYNEGDKARGNFEKAMKTIFKAPKRPKAKVGTPAKGEAGKPDSSDKD